MTREITIAAPIQWRQIGVSLSGSHSTVGPEFWITPSDPTSLWRVTLGELDLGGFANLNRARDAAQEYVDLGVMALLTSQAVGAVVAHFVNLATINPATYGDIARRVTDYSVAIGH